MKFHFLRELVKNGEIKLDYCDTKEQIADIMTKPVKLDMFRKLREMLGVRKLKLQTESPAESSVWGRKC